MEPHERVKMLESFSKPYSSYCDGKCVKNKPCKFRNPEQCRLCRQEKAP